MIQQLFFICAFFFAVALQAASYYIKKIELPGHTLLESHPQTFYYLAMNDEGVVCSSAADFNERGYKIFIGNGAVDVCDYCSKVLLNNRGWFIYEAGQRAILHSCEGKKIVLPEGEILALNDCNQVMGRDWKQGHYLWEEGKIDFSVFEAMRQDLEEQGYCVECLRPFVLNNQGMIAGYVQIAGSREALPFYWDGRAHVISCPLKLSPHISTIAINNRGEIVFTNIANSFLWRRDGDSVVIPDFCAISINDSSQILGELTKGAYFVPALWEKGEIATLAELLDFKRRPALYLEPYSHKYILNEPQALRDPVKINNRGEIVMLGKEGYRWIPCILSPMPQEQYTQHAECK